MSRTHHQSDVARYVFESLFTLMMRKNTKDPLAAAQISGKGGEIDAILWTRKYIVEFTKEHSKMFEVADSAAAAVHVQKVQELI